MYGGSTLSIGVTMFLRDQFSGPAQRIRSSAEMTQQQLLQMQEAQLRQQRNMYAGMAFAGVMALRGMGRMVKRAAELSYEMEFVKSITDASGEEQKKLTTIAKTLGRETMFYPQAIAEGMRFMAMAGMSAREVEQNIQGAVSLAGATKSELGGKGGAADVMTNVMKQFRVGFEYTNDVADLLSYAVTRANTNLFDLGEALKYAGSTSMDLSVSLAESTAMVMALGNAGIQGSMAGVAMENSMRYMSRAFSSFASGPSRKALAMIGMDVQDVTDQQGNLLTMTDIIQKMGHAIDKNFGEGMNLEKQAVLQSIFGVRGKRAGSLLIRNLKEFQQFTDNISTKSTGHSARIMEDMMSTLQGHFFKLGSAWQAMWASFTDKVGPMLIFVMKGTVKVLGFLERLFDKKIVGSFIASAIAGFLLLKTVTWTYKAVAAGIKLIFFKTQTSSVLMGNTVVGNYARMSAAANTFAMSATRANYAMMAGMAGTGKLRGLRTNAAGRIITSQGSRVVSGAASGQVAAGTAKVVGGKIIQRGAMGFALHKIAGFLGGPWGIAMAFVLPGLIGAAVDAMKGNKEATEKNTKALEEEERSRIRSESRYGRVGHMLTFSDLAAPEITAIGQSGMGAFQRQVDQARIDQLTTALDRLLHTKQLQPINIYIDNEKNIEQILERSMADSLQLLQ